jgi:PAS domain S-box-containing protein
LKLSHLGLGLVSALVLGEFVFVGALDNLLAESDKELDKETHAKKISAAAESIYAGYTEADRILSSYLSSRNEEDIDRYEQTAASVRSSMKSLAQSCKDDSGTALLTEKICADGTAILDIIDTVVVRVRKGESPLSLAGKLSKAVQPHLNSIFVTLQDLRQKEKVILEASPESQRLLRERQRKLLQYGLWANTLIALLIAVVYVKVISGRLRVLVENTERMKFGKELKPALIGSDEIAYLDGMFHEMAAAINEAARKERALVDHALDVICSVDSYGKFTSVSQACRNAWGFEVEDLVGTRLIDLVPEAEREPTRQALLGVKGPGGGGSFESSVVRKNGEQLSVAWSAQWLASEGLIYCVAHDITQRKRAEEIVRESEARIRSILERMPVGLLVCDQEGRIDLANSTVLRMLKYEQDELLTHRISQIFPSIKDELQSLKDKAFGKVAVFFALTKDNQEIPVDVSLSEFQRPGGSGLLIAMNDVTERFEVEKMKQAFVAMVSHDLRTPLTSVRGFLQLLEIGTFGELPELLLARAKQSENSIERLIRLINDLLDIERLEAGGLELTMENCSLADLAEKALDSVSEFAREKQVTLVSQVDAVQCHVDADRIVQVLVNLLSNAVKFSPENGVVTISSERGQDLVRILIADEGRGVPESMQSKIFERFQQVEVSDGKRGKGTGLGLTICKSIVQGHGGDIGVISHHGSGSTFWFSLPL